MNTGMIAIVLALALGPALRACEPFALRRSAGGTATIVKPGADERYGIPDALVSGG